MSYYKTYDDSNLNQILDKYEFTNDKVRNYVYQEPSQLLLRNIISPYSVYDRILLFHSTGSGKTCTSISIAEGFKEYLSKVNKKIFVLVKNKSIQANFYNELLSKCTGNEYINDEERELLSSIRPTYEDKYSELIKEVKTQASRDINKSYQFMTYGKFTNQVLGLTVKKTTLFNDETEQVVNQKVDTDLVNLNNTVIIVDEVHNILGNKTYHALMEILSRSINFKLILLTATPIYDNVESIIYLNNLLNVNDQEKILSKNIIEARLIDRNSIFKVGINSISNESLSVIKKNLLGKISYLSENEETNPKKIDMGTPISNNIGSVKIVYCEMSDYQYFIYKQAIESETSLKVNVEAIDNETSGSSLYKNSSDASTMVYPNNVFGKNGFYENIETEKGVVINEYKKILNISNVNQYSSKLYNIINNIKNGPSGNVFIYSNFVTAGGTNLIKYLLLANDIKKFVIIDDSITPKKREEYLKIFNSYENRNGDKIRIIVGSPVLSEGITLKCIKQIHILEPFWNMSKINQIIGRGVRNNSHLSLPFEDRYVNIYKYASIKTTDDQIFFIDQEKYKVSEAKDRNNKIIERLLKEISIDCTSNYKRNTITDTSLNNTDKCDYTDCIYKCEINNENLDNIIDKSTYKNYITFFEKYDMEYIEYTIRLLYKEYYVYTIDDIYTYLNTKVGYNLITIETVLEVLKKYTENKIIISDIHERDGFIYKKGIYYIFNALDKNIDASIFSKIFDFSKDENKLNLNEYSNKYEKYDLDEDLSVAESEIVSNYREETILDEKITNDIIEYNNNLIKTYDIIGSFRKRPAAGQTYGNLDNKFRLIDSSALSKISTSDRREQLSGTVIGQGQTKQELQQVAEKLGIEIQVKETKETLSHKIRVFLIDNNRVLH
jgi:superfamily II DNA or RNA helicase